MHKQNPYIITTAPMSRKRELMAEKITPVTEDEIDDIRVTLDTEEGEIECRILTIFEVDAQDYIALMPLDDKGNDNADGAVYLYRYAEDNQGLPSLSYIDDDEEYEAVADRYDELLDEAFYDSIDDQIACGIHSKITSPY